MSKVICDVCGTTYPETSAQCPICNSAKNSVDQTAAAGSRSGVSSAGSEGYTYVKGGRFSKKNVRKRGKGGSTAQRRSSRQGGGNEEPSNTGLIIVVVLLLIAIVAVVIYIGVHFFSNSNDSNANDSTTTAPAQTENQTKQTELSVPCVDLQLSNQIIEFMNEGETWTLVVALTPLDTTDEVIFTSSDPSVVEVSNDGVITAVGGGDAVITVSCGDVHKLCIITCSFGETEPSSDPTDSVIPGEFDFAFNTAYKDDATGYGDTTISTKGGTWKAYKSSLTIDPADITWTSDDESVCTVENGIVTAVGSGKTLIHASYNGVTYSCIVRCPFKDSGSSGSGDADNGSSATGDCKISHSDVSIAVGETFKLTLKDAQGNVLDVTWSTSDDNVTIDGNKITGAASGTVTVSTTYEGVTYSCIVRVK